MSLKTKDYLKDEICMLRTENSETEVWQHLFFPFHSIFIKTALQIVQEQREYRDDNT